MEAQKLRIAKTILPELFELDTNPLLPTPAQFSWEGLSKNLMEQLKLKGLQLQSEVPFYTKKSEFPYPHFTIAFYVGAIREPIYALVGKEEIENIARHLLGIQEKEPFEEGYLKGFKDFLVGMAIHTVEEQFQSDGWTLKASDIENLPEGPHLEFGVKALVDGQVSLDLIIAIPKQFLEEWRQAYQLRGYKSFYQESVQSLIELMIVMEIGWVKLKKEQITQLEPGDFICTDHLTWIPGKKRGRALLTYKEHPIFLVATKAEGFKILEQVNHYETGDLMAKDEEEFLEDEEEGEIEQTEEEEIEEEEEAAPAEQQPSIPLQADQEQKVEEEHPSNFSLTDSEVVIKIEVGRLKMTLDKLLQLEPGNILKLNTNLENGVNLIVNGKMIGRGELVSIGDLIGVRILNLGA